MRVPILIALAVSALMQNATLLAQGAGATGIPRMPDGKPDLGGFWQVLNTAYLDIQDHPASEAGRGGRGVVEGNEIPYTSEALKKKQQNFVNRATADLVQSKCFLPGVPRVMYMPFPFQIFATDGQVTMLFEYAHATRYIYTNGSPHPEGPIDWWMGDSRGRWEGDALVVDSVHFTDKTWFDRAGNHHSEQLHLVERFSLVDRDHMTYEVTIEDPKVFTRPWKMSMVFYRIVEKGFRLFEYDCYSLPYEKYYPYPEALGR